MPEKSERTVTGRGKPLITQRRARGLTVDQLASLTGLGVKTINRAEEGVEGVYLSTLKTIADALKMNFELLMADPPQAKSIDEPPVACTVVLNFNIEHLDMKTRTQILKLFETLGDLIHADRPITRFSTAQGSFLIMTWIYSDDAYRLCDAYLGGMMDDWPHLSIIFPTLEDMEKRSVRWLYYHLEGLLRDMGRAPSVFAPEEVIRRRQEIEDEYTVWLSEHNDARIRG